MYVCKKEIEIERVRERERERVKETRDEFGKKNTHIRLDGFYIIFSAIHSRPSASEFNCFRYMRRRRRKTSGSYCAEAFSSLLYYIRYFYPSLCNSSSSSNSTDPIGHSLPPRRPLCCDIITSFPSSRAFFRNRLRKIYTRNTEIRGIV